MLINAMKFGYDAILRGPEDGTGDGPPADDSALGGDDNPADDKPAEDNPADDKPADDKPASDDSALGGDDDDKSADDDKSKDDDKSDDDKSDDDKGSDDDKSKDSEADEDDDSGAPDEYEDFKLPDGRQVDKSVMTEFKEYAKGLKLTQKQAQGLVDMQVASAINNAKLTEEADAAKKVKQTTEWKDNLAKDEVYGGDNLKQTLSHARKAMKELGGDALRGAIVELGVGDHPELVKAFAKVGAEIADDSVTFGAGGFQKSRAQKLQGIYNKSNHN